jgi:hypothetical protein
MYRKWVSTLRKGEREKTLEIKTEKMMDTVVKMKTHNEQRYVPKEKITYLLTIYIRFVTNYLKEQRGYIDIATD